LTSINTVDNIDFQSRDGVLYDTNYSLLEYPEGRIGSFDIYEYMSEIKPYAFKDCTGLTAITIPPMLVRIASNSFEGCSNLKVVSYLGSFDPFTGAEGETAFNGCDSLHHICVPKGFFGYSFCGRDDFCGTDSCEDLHFYADHCYEETCLLGDVIEIKRKNATEYEEQQHACVDYACDIDVGPVAWSMCNSTETQRFMCSNGGCLRFGTSDVRVEIDVQDGVFAGDVNLVSLYDDLESLTNEHVLDVGIELRDDAYVIHVVVIVDDENSGTIVVNAVNNLDKGENCEYGVLCRTSTARLVTLEISEANNKKGIAKIAIVFVVLIMKIITMM